MTRDKEKTSSKPEDSVAEELDTLNAKVRAARSGPNVLRRTMESRIEAKAKRRRSSEGAAYSNWRWPA
jgi:hypothetical protein